MYGWEILSRHHKSVISTLTSGNSLFKLSQSNLWILSNCAWEDLDSRKIKPVNPKGNQPWIFIGRIDAEAEALILWPPNAKSRLVGKDLDAGKGWGPEAGMWVTEDEIGGWHHHLNGHEFEQTLRNSEGQGSLECCSPWGVIKSQTWLSKLSDWTPRIDWFDLLLVQPSYPYTTTEKTIALSAWIFVGKVVCLLF